jgi:hypothetical protein
MTLWDYLMIMEFVTIGPESAACLIGSHNPSNEVNRESVVREIRMLRLTRRGLETGFRVPRQPSTLPEGDWR